MHRIAPFVAGIAGIVFSVGRAPPTSTGAKSIRPWADPAPASPAESTSTGCRGRISKLPWTGLRLATFALGSWIGFLPMGNGAMFMGDLVLTENEISPVMKRLIDDGVEITAVHNHLLRTSPAVFYMHVGGHGDPSNSRKRYMRVWP